MQEIKIGELREIQLAILEYVNSFCTENKINYSLSGGTLIGAVRHKGYIPWDDDIDIMMPRPDYEKFCATFNDFATKNNLKLINSFNDRQFFQPFSKVVDTRTYLIETYNRPIDKMGVYIDVFPIDGLPNEEKKRDFYWKRIFKKRNFASVIYQKNNSKEYGFKKVARLVLFYLLKIFPANFFAKKINKTAMKNDYASSEYIACSVFGYGRKEEMPKSVFDSFIDVDFEGRKFKALAGWKTYLTNLYGDFMQLPPKEKQVAKHDFKAYWR